MLVLYFIIKFNIYAIAFNDILPGAITPHCANIFFCSFFCCKEGGSSGPYTKTY